MPHFPSPAAALALILSLGASSAAHAQLDMVTPQFNTQVLKDVLASNDRAFGRKPPSAPTAPGSPAQATTNTPATTYRPSPAISRRVQQQFAASLFSRVGRDGSNRIATAMVGRDPVGNWAQIVGADGLKPGDAADALAAYWVLNWVIANRSDSNSAQALGVRQQVRPMLLHNPAFTRLTEPERQEFAEALMLNFLLQHAAYGSALQRGSEPEQTKLAAAAVARFDAEMGVDLRSLALTPNGFVEKR